MENLKKFEDLEEIKSIDLQKNLIDEKRPFPKDLENKVFQKLKLDWNYNSNAIEGNQLSFGETVAFLNFGLTAKGKPFKDHLDIKGHNEAIQFMLQLIKENRPFSESDIKDLHKIILVEPYFTKTISQEGLEFGKEIKIRQYKTSPNHVKTISGDIHYYTNPEDVPYEMNQLLEWYREAEKENLHPVVLSSLFHHKFTAIHPFDDGNGRLARILSNFILLKHQYPVIVIKNNEKTQYYASLNIADNGIYEDLIKLFAENISNSFSIYQKALKGEDINEPDDLDKEIDLFLKESDVVNLIQNSEKDRSKIFSQYVINLFEYLLPKLSKIGNLFQQSHFNYSDSNYYIDDYNLFLDKIINDWNFIPIDSFELEIPFHFDDHIKEEFDLEFNFTISIKNKSIKYLMTHKWFFDDMIDGRVERVDVLYSKIYSYDDNLDKIYHEVSKGIINYLIKEIKNHSE